MCGHYSRAVSNRRNTVLTLVSLVQYHSVQGNHTVINITQAKPPTLLHVYRTKIVTLVFSSSGSLSEHQLVQWLQSYRLISFKAVEKSTPELVHGVKTN